MLVLSLPPSPLSIDVRLAALLLLPEAASNFPPTSGSPLRWLRGVFGVDLEVGGGQHLEVRHSGSSSVPGSLGQPMAQSWNDQIITSTDNRKNTPGENLCMQKRKAQMHVQLSTWTLAGRHKIMCQTQVCHRKLVTFLCQALDLNLDFFSLNMVVKSHQKSAPLGRPRRPSRRLKCIMPRPNCNNASWWLDIMFTSIATDPATEGPWLSTNSGWIVVEWMPSLWKNSFTFSAIFMYSERLRQRMCAEAITRSPVSCEDKSRFQHVHVVHDF